MTFLWLLVTLISAIFEATTASLVSFWFVLGGFLAMILSVLKVPNIYQYIVFIAASVLSIWLLRPMVQKYLNNKKESTNVDRLIGRICLVTERIEKLKNTGEVVVDGQRWSAKPKDEDMIFEVGDKVEIIAIKGVKLIVKKHE